MSCTAVIERLSTTTAIIRFTYPDGFFIGGIASINTTNCTATLVPGSTTINITDITDRAYISFPDNAIYLVGAAFTPIFQVGVANATAASPLQVPLACNFCGTETPMTGETYMRLIRGRATASGPGPDVRIVARRRWGDDFAGCSVCNNVPPTPAPAPGSGVIID